MDGGAYAYKTTGGMGHGAAGVGARIRRKARADWLALMPHAHDGYVSWEKAEAIRTMVSSNVPTLMFATSSCRHGNPLLVCLPSSSAQPPLGRAGGTVMKRRLIML